MWLLHCFPASLKGVGHGYRFRRHIEFWVDITFWVMGICAKTIKRISAKLLHRPSPNNSSSRASHIYIYAIVFTHFTTRVGGHVPKVFEKQYNIPALSKYHDTSNGNFRDFLRFLVDSHVTWWWKGVISLISYYHIFQIKIEWHTIQYELKVKKLVVKYITV